MLNAGKRYNRVFQLGTQLHAFSNYRRVVELIQAGVIGKIHTVRAWKGGYYPNPRKVSPCDILSGFSHNTWQGPVPRRPYNPNCVHGLGFRIFCDYSFGTMADFWCHISDVAFGARVCIVTYPDKRRNRHARRV